MPDRELSIIRDDVPNAQSDTGNLLSIDSLPTYVHTYKTLMEQTQEIEEWSNQQSK